MCSQLVTLYAGFAISFCFLIAGIVLFSIENKVVLSELHKQLDVVEGTLMYENWLESPPVKMGIWIWNVTNAADFTRVLKPNKFGPDEVEFTFPEPVFEQVGPFYYEETYFKDPESIKYVLRNGSTVAKNVDLPESEFESVISLQKRIFKPMYDINDSSTGLDPHSVEVSIMNLIALGLPKMLQFFSEKLDLSDLAYNAAASAVNSIVRISESLPVVMNVPANDILFGYEEPIIELVKSNCDAIPFCDQIPDEFGLLVIQNTGCDFKMVVDSNFQNKLKFLRLLYQ